MLLWAVFMRNSNHCFPCCICGNVHCRNFRKWILSIILPLRQRWLLLTFWCKYFQVSIVNISGDYNNTVIKQTQDRTCREISITKMLISILKRNKQNVEHGHSWVMKLWVFFTLVFLYPQIQINVKITITVKKKTVFRGLGKRKISKYSAMWIEKDRRAKHLYHKGARAECPSSKWTCLPTTFSSHLPQV